MTDNGMPDPDEFAKYLEAAGFNVIDAQMNQYGEMVASVITKAAGLKKHAVSKGFSEAVSEEIAFNFVDRLVNRGGESA
ncbi:hypothetical protein AB0I84_01860 [Streptomyces spectabilis]|uniref:hypothetical protein n=1 Tax=Streptomyces spectabilis TaxID=68270 RepID=UPI0033E63A7D